MILPLEMQPNSDQIGKRYISPFAGILWEAVYAGETHRGLDVFDLVAEWGRTGRGYSRGDVWLIVVDDWPGI
jgi:hypothetical protein